MSFKKLLLSSLILFFFCFSGSSQNQKDTIQQKTYDEIFALYRNAVRLNNFTLQVLYGETYLEKGKTSNDLEKIVVGYRILSLTHKDEKILQYSDSIIQLTKEGANSKYPPVAKERRENLYSNYPAVAYEKKGDFFYEKKAYQRALNNYLEFNRFAKKYDEKVLIFRSNYMIGALKRRIGNTEEALGIFRKNFAFAKENAHLLQGDNSYLNSISALASIFNDQQELDSASYYNKYGVNESLRLKNDFYYSHFAATQGITLFHQKNYATAIDSLEKYIPHFEKFNNLVDLPHAYFYCGESYRLLMQEEKAIAYYKKIDELFQKTQSLFPSIREVYMRLDDYYKEKGDAKSRLKYLAQLSKADSILNADQIYLSEKIIKKYDIPKIKEGILKETKAKDRRFKNIILILSVSIVLLVLGFSIQYRKRRIYKKRFDEIIKRNQVREVFNEKRNETENTINIPKEVIAAILEGLAVFEKENEFISNEITLGFLAKKLSTNPNYLSKVINHSKRCSFSTYINDLRIDYCVEQLKNDSSYQKYTIKAISSEMGFNNVQSFTKSFYRRIGINPSFFLKELKKRNG